MISLLFVLFACFFNAIMDAVENENFYESIFSDNDKSFWYKRESWKSALKVFGYKFDVWHLSKSAMLICFIVAIVSYKPIFTQFYDFVIIGALWVLGFKLFYHTLFKVK